MQPQQRQHRMTQKAPRKVHHLTSRPTCLQPISQTRVINVPHLKYRRYLKYCSAKRVARNTRTHRPTNHANSRHHLNPTASRHVHVGGLGYRAVESPYGLPCGPVGIQPKTGEDAPSRAKPLSGQAFALNGRPRRSHTRCGLVSAQLLQGWGLPPEAVV